MASSNYAAGSSNHRTDKRHRASTLSLVLTLLAILPVLTRHIKKGEFNYNVDETQHAFTGVFVADLIRHHPVHDPVGYTYLYYVRYPALSGIIHWPPLFYLCEGVAFLFLGSSVVTARVVILLFALLGLGFWFRLVEKLHCTWAAVAATVLLAFCPGVLLFEKTVMLEVPSLAMCLVASYFWICFLREGRSASLYWFALTGALAMLTKQNSIYLLLFCLISVVALRKWNLLRRRATLVALAIGLCLTGPYYYLLYRFHWTTVSGAIGESQANGIQRLAFYWKAVPQLTGWLVLILALAGIVTCVFWNRTENNLIFISWILSAYLVMTPIGMMEVRYFIYAAPAVVYFAIWPLLVPKEALAGLRFASLVLLAAMAVLAARSAWLFQRPYVSGYAPVARQIRQLSDSGTILVDADIPANLIFFLKHEDSAGRFVVLRKSLYAFRIEERLGAEEYIHTREDLEKLLADDGIRFIVVSNRPPAHFPIEVILRQMLVAPQFRLVNRFPIEGNSPEWTDYYLSLYENTWAGAPRVETLRIPMLTLDHDIEVPFQKLGITPALHSSTN